MFALLATTLAAFAGGDFGLSVDVLDEVCLDDANVEIHLAVTHGSYPESPWYRWDFDADGCRSAFRVGGGLATASGTWASGSVLLPVRRRSRC